MPVMTRTHHRIGPDASRLVARPFLPGGLNFGGEPARVELIVSRILDLEREERRSLLTEVTTRSAERHRGIEDVWLEHFELLAARVERLRSIGDDQLRLLIGAYFTQAYAYEAASLTNPSIVPLADGPDGSGRFVMSARAIGEGHISSIEFLTGTVDRSGDLSFDERHPTVSNGTRGPYLYDLGAFSQKLDELAFANEVSARVIASLPDPFSMDDLDRELLSVTETDLDPVLVSDTTKRVHWLAASNYELEFDSRFPISEHLISPAAPAESHGMEDARFVRFVDDDATITYYATYTAYDGMRILPQLIETTDFHSFRMTTMSGPTAYHKGTALFPRKIDGEFVALSRHDHETTFIMRSEAIGQWTNAEAVLVPEEGWEAIQNGNCGSPLETEAGWLVITHGVGPMRRYVLGAVLLDLDEPSKVVGRLRSPLLEPEESEEFGYVPDVVYSCGSMIYGDTLILPYGCADHSIRVAITPVDQLLSAMT